MHTLFIRLPHFNPGLFLILAGIVLTIAALVDVVRSEFKGNDKIAWVIVILLFNFVGAIIYFAIGRNQKTSG